MLTYSASSEGILSRIPNFVCGKDTCKVSGNQSSVMWNSIYSLQTGEEIAEKIIHVSL